jgi:hypothetical protein
MNGGCSVISLKGGEDFGGWTGRVAWVVARWALVLVMLAGLAAVTPVSWAQKGNCDEKTVRRRGEEPIPDIAADDIYVNSQNSEKPIVGIDKLIQFRNQQFAGRKNNRPPKFEPERVVTSNNSNMAYEYGKAHVEYDLATTGQHVSYDLDYLRVWRVEGKVCKVAALFSRAQKLSGVR